MGLGKQIRKYRQQVGLTLQQLAELSGVDTGTISALEQRDSARSQYFPDIAKALGLSVEELGEETHGFDLVAELDLKTQAVIEVRKKRGQEVPSFSRSSPDDEVPQFSRGTRVDESRPAFGMQPILAWEHEEDLPPGEFVMIPRLDVHLSAGAGRDQVEIELTKASPQAFRSEWIRERRLKPNKLAAMTASGDSMEPSIHDGDSLLVDTSQSNVQDGKVYALWYDGGERVKRLYRLPGGGLRIKSDNPTYDPIELGPEYSGHVRIIGRVVHRSGTGGL